MQLKNISRIKKVRIIKCVKCSVEVETTSSNRKHCNNCQEKIRKETQRKLYLKEPDRYKAAAKKNRRYI